MTALVGVLNKLGIAVAADSASTITTVKETHIFNNGKKIFPLSDSEPVAVMLAGNADFLNTPLSLLIGLYRNKRGDQTFPSLTDYVRDFLEFIESFKSLQTDTAKRISYQKKFFDFMKNFRELLNQKLQWLNENYEDLKEIDLNKETYNHAFTVLEKVILQKDLNPSLESFSKEDFHNDVVELIGDFIDGQRRGYVYLSDERWQELLHLFYRDLINNEFDSPVDSEIVFIGYGEEDLFPSIQTLHLSDMVGDKLKYKIGEIDTVSDLNPAIISAFGQKETIFGVINGVTPDFAEEYWNTTIELEEGIMNEIIDLLEENKASKKIIDKIMNLSFTELHNQYAQRINEFRSENYSNSATDSLAAFDLKDMAKMVETLIKVSVIKNGSITSEVGGPIEVAVISKTTGFQWINHKE